MKPVMQTRLHGADGAPGNCFAACIASILGVPIESVPQPTEADRESWADYWSYVGAFLWDRGFALVHVPFPELQKVTARHWTTCDALDDVSGPYYIGSGPSPRGSDHSVVMRDGRIEHDPHPSGDGIEGLLHIDWIVPLWMAAAESGEEG